MHGQNRFLDRLPQGKLGQTGIQYHWKLDGSSSGSSFTLLVSGAKPCDGFRVWLHHELTQEEEAERLASAAKLEALAEERAAANGRGANEAGTRQGAAGGGSLEELARHVDVTSLVAQLPPLHQSARMQVRNWRCDWGGERLYLSCNGSCFQKVALPQGTALYPD